MPPVLSITKNYQDGTTLTETQLDTALTDVETFVNTTKLDSDNIQDGGLDADTLASNAVTEAKINSGAVTTGKIADNAVTHAKLAARSTGTSVGAGGVAISSSCGNYSMTSTTRAQITNFSVSLTTTGRPVCLKFIPDGSTSEAYVGGQDDDASSQFVDIYFVRGGADVAHISLSGSASGVDLFLRVPPASVSTIDFPAAGTYTYTAEIKCNNSGVETARVSFCKLVAYEL